VSHNGTTRPDPHSLLDVPAAKRRRLPMVSFDKPYVFDSPSTFTVERRDRMVRGRGPVRAARTGRNPSGASWVRYARDAGLGVCAALTHRGPARSRRRDTVHRRRRRGALSIGRFHRGPRIAAGSVLDEPEPRLGFRL